MDAVQMSIENLRKGEKEKNALYSHEIKKIFF
jgi:hypothetical protein